MDATGWRSSQLGFFNPVACRLRFNSPPPINQTLARCCAERASWTRSSSLAAAAKPPEMFIPACDLSLDEGSGAVCRRTPAPPLIGRNLTLAHLASMSTVTSSCPCPWAPALYSARPKPRETDGRTGRSALMHRCWLSGSGRGKNCWCDCLIFGRLRPSLVTFREPLQLSCAAAAAAVAALPARCASCSPRPPHIRF